jgi:hypothetical protein
VGRSGANDVACVAAICEGLGQRLRVRSGVGGPRSSCPPGRVRSGLATPRSCQNRPMMRETEVELIPTTRAALRLHVSRWTVRRWLLRDPSAGRKIGNRWYVRGDRLSSVRPRAVELPESD